ncbi:Cytochrome P450 7A1 [Pseudocercospora fuligena]|uniref:Cytochrome P450 7A1 n=1 Tax=Pseudocercospora fuligena TaxID=685502 RepID=A0A8H6R9H6_9PEZI|nr:Cytochrome P450 7A1 [Pseudocercospora fuligena]
MDKDLLTQLRAEIQPYIRLRAGSGLQGSVNEQGSSASLDFEIFDYNGLIERCALLKSCYIECLRVHTASWSFKMVKEDFSLQARKDSQGWLLRKGDYCHAAHELHNTDPNYFEDPLEFKPNRHIKYDPEKGYDVADLGTIRPYGGGSSMCKGRHFAVKEVMIFTAAIISMWDMEAAGGGEWKMPASRKTTATHGTDDECRVWVSRRSQD